MKRLAIALGFVLAAVTGSVVAAPVFSLGGYQGPITIKFKDFESLTQGLTVGSQNFGTVNITQITDLIGNSLWSNGGSNGYLAAVFNGLTINSVTSSGGNDTATALGGHMDIYLSSTPFDPTQGLAGYAAAGGGCAIGQLCYNTVSNNPGGILFLSLDFAPGADVAGDTLVGTFTGLTYPTSGSALGYFDVLGGAYASTFDTNGLTTAIGTKADMLLQNTFCPNGNSNCQSGTPIGDWQLLSDDPVRATVPEPASIALVGIGLLALFAGSRRRRRVN